MYLSQPCVRRHHAFLPAQHDHNVLLVAIFVRMLSLDSLLHSCYGFVCFNGGFHCFFLVIYRLHYPFKVKLSLVSLSTKTRLKGIFKTIVCIYLCVLFTF